MTSRLPFLAAALTLMGGCIFGPSSSSSDDAGADGSDTSTTDVATDGDATSDTDASGDADTDDDADAQDDPPCEDCVGTFAGSGVRGAEAGDAMRAQFDTLVDVAVDPTAGDVFAADSTGHRLWRVQDNQVTPYAGTGECSHAADAQEASNELCTPRGLYLAGTDDIYVAECVTDKIKRVQDGSITWVAGAGDDEAPWEEDATKARLDCPTDIVAGGDNVFYIAGNDSHRIHEFTNGKLAVLAGRDEGFKDDSNPDNAQFRHPTSLVYDGANQRLVVLDRGNHCLRAVALDDDNRGATTTLAGDCENPGRTEPGPASGVLFDDLQRLALDGDQLYVTARGRLFSIDFGSPELGVRVVTGLDAVGHHADGPSDRAKLHAPRGLTPFVDAAGKATLLVAEAGGRTIRKVGHIDPADDLPAIEGGTDGATIETVAGTGLRGDTRGAADAAEFAAPFDIVAYRDGYLVADRFNHQVLEYKDDELSVFAGSGSCETIRVGQIPAAEATLCEPVDLHVDDNTVYVVVRGHHLLRKVESGTVRTVVGTSPLDDEQRAEAPWEGDPLNVKLESPEAVTVDGDGHIYIAGGFSHAIHRLNADSGEVEIFAGRVEEPGKDDRQLHDSKFRNPRDIISVRDSLFVADYGNHCIRQITNESVDTAVGECEESGVSEGAPEDARLESPLGLASGDYDDDTERELIVLDRYGVSILDGEPLELARIGAWDGWRDGALDRVGLTRPTSAVIVAPDTLLVTERDGDRIRRINF